MSKSKLDENRHWELWATCYCVAKKPLLRRLYNHNGIIKDYTPWSAEKYHSISVLTGIQNYWKYKSQKYTSAECTCTVCSKIKVSGLQNVTALCCAQDRIEQFLKMKLFLHGRFHSVFSTKTALSNFGFPIVLGTGRYRVKHTKRPYLRTFVNVSFFPLHIDSTSNSGFGRYVP